MRNEQGHFVYDEVVTSPDGSIGFTPLPYEQTLRQLNEALVKDKDARLKRVLIELGWTPPST